MMFRLLLRKFLEGRGYTRHQAKKLIAGLDWARVREIIREYGPMLLQIFLALLPLFLSKEAPFTMGQCLPGDEEEDYNFPFHENELSSRALSESIPVPGTCTRPPEGYFCTKEEGHEGPCPTLPK